MKTTRQQLNNAFSEVECLDRLIICVLVREPLEVADGLGLWKGFPPVVVTPDFLALWKPVDMVLVARRRTGTIAVEFSQDSDGQLHCLMPEDERKRLNDEWMG